MGSGGDPSDERPDTAEAERAPDPAAGGDDAARLRQEVAALRREVARLALALQVERERTSRLTTALAEGAAREGEPAAPADDSVPGDLPRGEWSPAVARQVARDAALRLRAALEPGREPEPATSWRRWTWWEVVGFAAILIVAVVARFWGIPDLPEGFQGDEAAGGIVARQIQRDGWIGPYSTIAAGVPTGFFYVIAVAMAVLDDEVLAIRVVPALFGVLAVVMLYLFVRRSFGVAAALASAGILATLGWHIHFSRISFPIIAWPFFVLLGLLALVEAVRSADWRWWAGAGVALGLGVYTYNSHVVLVALIALAVAVRLFGGIVLGFLLALALAVERPGFLSLLLLGFALLALLSDRRVQDGRRLTQALVFTGALVLVAWPMIRYAADDTNNYFGYGRRLSVFNTQEWTSRESAGDQVGFIAGRYREYWDRLCCHPRLDGVDATGVTAVIPFATLALAAIGIGFTLRPPWRTAPTLAALLLLTMPLTSALSIDYALRRSLVVTVFVALFAGVGAVMAMRAAWRRGLATRLLVGATVLWLVSISTYRNLDDYFGTTVESQEMHWTLAVEMVEASHFIAGLPPDTYVYFYSERWPWEHEIRRFFAPDARGDDRSDQFGTYDFTVDPAAGRPVFLFLDTYRADYVNAQARYPGGQLVIVGPPENPSYVVYLAPEDVEPVPEPPAPAPPDATPAPSPGGRG